MVNFILTSNQKLGKYVHNYKMACYHLRDTFTEKIIKKIGDEEKNTNKAYQIR